MTRACSGPMQAATAAAAPHAIRNQNTLLVCVTRSSSSGATSISVQTVSLTKALLPCPSAKNEYRQLSCSSRPGRIRPSARKARPGVPPSSAAATSAHAPVIRPVTRAVPVHCATARRQLFTPVPLNLTSSGSVARPREAVSANE